MPIFTHIKDLTCDYCESPASVVQLIRQKLDNARFVETRLLLCDAHYEAVNYEVTQVMARVNTYRAENGLDELKTPDEVDAYIKQVTQENEYKEAIRLQEQMERVAAEKAAADKKREEENAIEQVVHRQAMELDVDGVASAASIAEARKIIELQIESGMAPHVSVFKPSTLDE